MYLEIWSVTIIFAAYIQSQEIEPLYVLIFLPMDEGNVRISDINKIGAYLAKEQIERNRIIDPAKYKIILSFLDDGCDGTVAISNALKEFSNMAQSVISLDDTPWYVNSVIGITCNQACRTIGSYYGAVWVSVVSIGCHSSVFINAAEDDGYPSFARVGASMAILIPLTIDLIQLCCWEKVAIITQADLDWFRFSSILKENITTVGNIDCNTDYTIQHERIRGKVTQQLKSYSDCRRALSKLYFSLSYKHFIFLLNDALVLACLLAANDLHISSNCLFVTYGYSVDRYGSFWPDEKAEQIIFQEGLISINVRIPEEEWEKFQNKSDRYYANNKDKFNGNLEELNTYGALLHDAVLLWAYAANETMRMTENTVDGFLKEEISDFFMNVTFEGASGNVKVEEDRVRKCDYTVQVVTDNMNYVELYRYYIHNKSLVDVSSPDGISLPGNVSALLSSDECKKKHSLYIYWIVGIVVFAAFLIIFLLAVFCYRKVRRESDMKAVNAWLIKWDDVITNTPEKEQLYTAAVQRILLHEVCRVTFGADTQKQEKFSDVGYYKGVIVSIKLVECRSMDRRDPMLLGELRDLINIKHENLNMFVGVCLDEPNVCMLTLYAKHGSLHDVLMDDETDLPLEFKLSFALDISKGLEYLHTSVLGSHGHLSSTNCVVDKKWTCKVTDFGMGDFQKMKKQKELENASNQLWTAPELLRLVEAERPLYGTQKGDVYSYGIILQELAMRDLPFADKRKTLELVDILAKIAVVSKPPFRPTVLEDSCSEEWRSLMVHCWSENPDDRPVFKKITVSIRKMGKGKTMNIIDNMLEKLEKHTQHLENLVAERTNDLNAEKRKVESLLYNILPKVVAESLLRRGYVDPEMFEAVTIYFSDIVGFIHIGQNSTAHQVVNLLNVLYSKFDEITDKYDVYKCETIGDVYMVASGLPVRNGDRHAPEITTMALHLLSAISSFTIPHMSDSMLQLRIGLHTGSVVAGVVGLKMPHYCLFGDTVNTASRMQSGGLALRIHISSVTADILRATGVFFLELRGEREVKGKGIMTTYWVLGKKGFNMPMPDLSKAAKPEEHDFK